MWNWIVKHKVAISIVVAILVIASWQYQSGYCDALMSMQNLIVNSGTVSA